VGNSAALVKSAASRNVAASTKSVAGADGNLYSGRSKACEAVMLAACVLAVGNWLVGEHVNAVAAVSYVGKKVARTWDNGYSSFAGS